MLLSHLKEKLMPFAATWMELEILTLSEVNQKETGKYHTIPLFLWNLKYGTDHPIKKKKKEQNQNQIMAKEIRLGVPRAEGEGCGTDGHFGGFLHAHCYIWNGWAMRSHCTAQGSVCDWVTLLYNNLKKHCKSTIFILKN